MYELKACVVCFSQDVKLHAMESGQMRHEFYLITGLETRKGSGLPDHLCYLCLGYLKKCKMFRDKCQRAHFALQEILYFNKTIQPTNLTDFNRTLLGVMPILQYSSTLLDDSSFNMTAVPVEFQVNNNEFKDETVQVKQEIKTTELDTRKDDAIVNESSSNVLESSMDDDNTFVSDTEQETVELNNISQAEKPDVAGSYVYEEYAVIIPISIKEAKAAVEVYKLYSVGKLKCEKCSKAYDSEKWRKKHMRMHEKHISGTYRCEICDYYYKTENLLKTHMTEKHMYKYVCRKCPDVHFDRTSAKKHYMWTHLQRGSTKDGNERGSRPSWLSNKGVKRVKSVVSLKPVKKLQQVPKDFLLYSPIQHEEQYALVQERQNSRNYKESNVKCNLCFRGFREMTTYNTHMKKHNPDISGPLQCDMCKFRFRTQSKMYKHMKMIHLFKYSCQLCPYVCYNRTKALLHYSWHKNVKYQCPHCEMEFSKQSSRLTHIRVKHPSMNLCNLCGHSFVSAAGLSSHKRITHTKEEIELSSSLVSNKSDPLYCGDCNMQFVNKAAFDTHFGSSYKHASTNLSSKRKRIPRRATHSKARHSEIHNNGRTTSTTCEVCNVVLASDVETVKHYKSEHPDTKFLKRYMCDVCGHTSKQYANLTRHMLIHTDEKPYACPLCDRRFNSASNRNNHLVVHTGEKRFQCTHCNQRFTQSGSCKLHIQTVHLKIPYVRPNRRKRKELENANIGTPPVRPPIKQQKFETQGDYLNAYINHNDD